MITAIKPTIKSNIMLKLFYTTGILMTTVTTTKDIFIPSYRLRPDINLIPILLFLLPIYHPLLLILIFQIFLLFSAETTHCEALTDSECFSPK